MLKIFCWVCFTRHVFLLPQQSTLAVCSECGNPEGALRPLTPAERIFQGLKGRRQRGGEERLLNVV